MNKLPVQRQSRSLLPELSELLTGFQPFAGFRPIFEGRIRIEEHMEDGYYEVRAELPGIDPAEDVDITVRDGRLTIKAERADTHESNGRSEFTYGSFTRSISLPVGADEEEITATYAKGIVTVSVPIFDSEPTETHVPVYSTETDVEVETEDAEEAEDGSADDEDADVESADADAEPADAELEPAD